MDLVINKLVTLNQLTIPGTDIKLEILSVNLFNRGIISSVGSVISLIFTFFIVAWIVIIIRAALSIVRSQGNEQEIEKGTTAIKNVWFGITAFIVFVVALSIAGNFVGYGNVYEWSKNFEQCGGRGFYFTILENDVGQLRQQFPGGGNTTIFCCEQDDLENLDPGWKVVRQVDPQYNMYLAACTEKETVKI